MRLAKQLQDESGQTVVVVALCMVVIMCFLGLAIDVGHLRYEKRALQTAADAAAVAAGLELRICGTVPNCPAMQAAAMNALVENGISGTALLTGCAPAGSSTLTMTLNSPPCALGSRDPNTGSNRYVEVILRQQQRTFFGRLVGFDKVNIAARAEATRNPGAPCIYALDQTGANAITVDVGLVSACPIIDESSSANAFTCLLSATVTAPQIKVTGGAAGLLCATSPAPRLNSTRPTPADPLAYLPKPAVPACGTSTKSPYHGSSTVLNLTLASGPVTLYPDKAYCGGINLAVGAVVTMQPGTYVIKSNNSGLLGATAGGMSISLGSTLSGSGVTIYNYGPEGGVTMALPSVLGLLGHTTLTAPTSGTYGGMLFIQDPGNTDAATILASAAWNTKLEGAFYFPSAMTNYAVTGTSTYNILVAKDIHFLAVLGLGSSFSNNYSALNIGSPLNGDADVLVQ